MTQDKQNPQSKKTIKQDSSAIPSLTLDIGRYDEFLQECDWSDQQKAEFLNALWSIVIAFVDMGFGMDATQAACGKLLESAFGNMFDDSHDVESEVSALPDNFKTVSKRKEEGVPS